MKKLLCCIFIILFLTGCGRKLECFIEEKSDDYSILETITLKFDEEGTEIKKGIYSLNLKVTDDYTEYLNESKSTILLEYTNLYDIGVKRKLSLKDNTLKFILKYNASKYSKDEKDKLLNHSLYFYGTYEQVKTELEKDGYKCNEI